LTTTLSLGSNAKKYEILPSSGEDETRISEQLATGLLIGDCRRMDQRRAEEKGSAVKEAKEGLLGETTMPNKRKQFVRLPAGFSLGVGGNVLERKKEHNFDTIRGLDEIRKVSHGYEFDQYKSGQDRNITDNSDDTLMFHSSKNLRYRKCLLGIRLKCKSIDQN
jgi:hypothetical protein